MDNVGSFNCSCNEGFVGSGVECKDIDECLANISLCDLHADCQNTVGSYECSCLQGYEGNGFNCSGKIVLISYIEMIYTLSSLQILMNAFLIHALILIVSMVMGTINVFHVMQDLEGIIRT